MPYYFDVDGLDPNGNASANNFIPSYTTTATAAGTTTLTVASTEIQRFSGVTTQTVVLPVVSTLPKTGFGFWIVNDSSGSLTVNSSGGNLVATITGGNRLWVFAILLTGTSAASWDTMPVIASPATISGLTTGQNVVAASASTIATDGVLRYTALLTQTSTNAPVATVLQNTLGGTVTWARTGAGTYTATLASVFASGKTLVFVGWESSLPITGFAMFKVTRTSTSVITLETAAINTPADDVLTATSFKIEVWS